MNHDGHNFCQHATLAYCRACDAVYCRGCASEWPTRFWNHTFMPYQTIPSTTWVSTTTVGEAGSTTITSAACSHN